MTAVQFFVLAAIVYIAPQLSTRRASLSSLACIALGIVFSVAEWVRA